MVTVLKKLLWRFEKKSMENKYRKVFSTETPNSCHFPKLRSTWPTLRPPTYFEAVNRRSGRIDRIKIHSNFTLANQSRINLLTQWLVVRTSIFHIGSRPQNRKESSHTVQGQPHPGSSAPLSSDNPRLAALINHRKLETKHPVKSNDKLNSYCEGFEYITG